MPEKKLINHFIRTEMISEMSPPPSTVGVIGWMRVSLFNSITSTVATILLAYFVINFLIAAFDWMVVRAVFVGEDREACLGKGACWVYIGAKLKLLIYGFYPVEHRWRVDIVGATGLGSIVFFALLSSFGSKNILKYLTTIFLVFFFVVYPYFSLVLLYGGFGTGLEVVETDRWGGLLVTLVIAYAGVFGSFPIALLFALGRRSKMPIIRLLSIIFIEFWRGVPLITVLFMASNMLQYFLPAGVSFDKLLRVLIGVMLFSAAYLAEVIRGGLQAIPKGQYEAAVATGMTYFNMMRFIILPQAIKIVIPGIVNSFIALFKDTTLVLIIGLYDFLGMLQSTFSDTKWATPQQSVTAYAFAAAVYWVFCFSMSRYSGHLEKKLDTVKRS